MADGLGVEVSGLDEAIAKVQGIQKRSQNWARELRIPIGIVIQSEVDEVFNRAPSVAGGTAYNGESWPGLSAATLKRNPKRQGGQLLRDTGQLAQSLQVGGRGNILQSSSDSIVFGTSLPKARALNNGAQIQRQAGTRAQNFKVDRTGKSRFARKSKANFQQDVAVPAGTITIPKRTFLKITPRMQELVAMVITTYIATGQK